MRNDLVDRCDGHAKKRKISRALIMEAALTEYLEKLDNQPPLPKEK
jgi:predicted transcriptional regulator